jgi:hypothetical protein
VSVVVNDVALTRFLRSTLGPVGQDLAIRAAAVEEKARSNASGSILGIRSRDLLDGLGARVDSSGVGLFAVIGTDAIHRGFNYPAFHDENGRPWLTNALRDGFRFGRSS